MSSATISVGHKLIGPTDVGGVVDWIRLLLRIGSSGGFR
jgi:hypothetical protein